MAENKQIYISMIEKILIENSIDCNLNHSIIKYEKNKSIPIETSQKVSISNYPVGDRDDDKHTGVECANKINSDEKINSITFSNKIYIDDISGYVELIKSVFESKPIKTYVMILEDLENKIKIDEDLLKFTLEEMLNSKTPIRYNNDEGYLIYLSNLYMFQMHNLNTQRIVQRDRLDKENNVQNVILIKDDNSVINQNMESMLKVLAVDIEALKKYSQDTTSVYDYVIDRLTYSNFNILLEEISKLDDNLLSSDHVTHIVNSMEKAHIFRMRNNTNKYYALNIYNGSVDDIYILDFDKKQYMKGNDIDLFTFREELQTNTIQLSEGIGFMDFTKTNNILFKIIGKNGKSGTVCGTGATKHGEYVEIINAMDNKVLGKSKHTNKQLCIILELLLRKFKKFCRPFDFQLYKKIDY